jgi:hypothetical protein
VQTPLAHYTGSTIVLLQFLNPFSIDPVAVDTTARNASSLMIFEKKENKDSIS